VRSPNIEAVLLLPELYLMAALPIVLVTVAVLWYLKKRPFLWFEYVTWVTPSVTYWFLWDIMGGSSRFLGRLWEIYLSRFF